MNDFFADLHIHIGRTETGKPVKITGSRTLTLRRILQTAKAPKGLDIIGIIDCHAPEVISELESLLLSGELIELEEGGFRYQKKVTLIPGAEIEVNDESCLGPIHVLSYFPTLKALKSFSSWLSKRVKNVTLSTQRIYEDAQTLQRKIKSLDGLFIPAHVFTPFKSLYGKGVLSSLTEVFDPHLIDGIEIGLSADTEMADSLKELHRYTLVSNSDAHSLPNIAREYQKIHGSAPTFASLKKALHQEAGHQVSANYGLHPLLGKYYTTTCAKCYAKKEGTVCHVCGARNWIKGVSERIEELKTATKQEQPPKRPPYIHQVPLKFLPGLGPKTFNRLLNHFGTEMQILHHVSKNELLEVVNEKIASHILAARNGTLSIIGGGGGRYGRVR